MRRGVLMTDESAAPAATSVEQPAPSASVDEGRKWWQWVLWGVAVCAGGLFIFDRLSNLEEHGGSIRMNALFVMVYDTLGKWGLLVVFELVGLLLIAIGTRKRAAAKK